jgi:DNA-binding NarL/FixJ family response regulator
MNDRQLAVASKPQPRAAALIRVLIVDDHSVMREGLALRIEAEQNMQVVGCVGDGEAAIATVRRLRPDVVIMDLVLPSLNGIEATRRILCQFPQTLVIALSACNSLGHVRRTMRAGARAYVRKSATGTELTDAINMAVAGKTYYSHDLVQLHGVPALDGAPGTNPMEDLSDRERQVLPLLIAGMTSAQIAQVLLLSCKTVETYRSRMMIKLGVFDRATLIRVAREYELPDA